MPTLENLGLLIREKRGDLGIRAAAKEVGISHATLSRVERGHLPDLENYEKICRWLGVGLDPVDRTKEANKNRKVPEVHFRKNPTVSPETAHALGQLILAAQAYMDDHQ